MSQQSGYLLAWPDGPDLTRDLLVTGSLGRDRSPSLLFLDHYLGLRRWERFLLTSDIPLAEEDGSHGTEVFRYNLFCVRSGAKVIVLAERKKIAEYVIENIFDRRIYPNLRKVNIVVDKLIDSCTSHESEYLITSVHGRYAGNERPLKSMSLYGDDITDSAIFKNNRELFNFFSCGVGRRLFDDLPKLGLVEDREILQIGNDGFISVRLKDRKRALEVMRVINYIMVNRWVDDWVPGIEKEWKA